MLAANFLDIPALFELCSATFACYFKGTSFEKMKKEIDEGETLDDVFYNELED